MKSHLKGKTSRKKSLYIELERGTVRGENIEIEGR